MIAIRLALSAAALAYGVVAIPSGLDRISRDTPAIERAVPWPFRAQADRSAATTQIVRQESGAIAYARAATAHDPVDPGSTALLGSALLLAQNYPAADKAFRIAARFGWRDMATQAYWLDASLQANDFAHAADRADAMLRAHPLLADEERLLGPIEQSPGGRAALAEHLSSRPPWLAAYLGVTEKTPATEVGQRFAVISQVRVSQPLGCEVVAPLTRELLRIGNRTAAASLWNRHCPERRVDGLLGDSHLAFLASSSAQEMPFAWVRWPTGDIELSPAEAGGGIVVTNAGSSGRIVLYQPVQLPPGSYLVRAIGETEGPATRVSASLACQGRFDLDDSAQGEILKQGQVVVANDCRDQQLGIWMTGNNSKVRLRSIQLTAVK